MFCTLTFTKNYKRLTVSLKEQKKVKFITNNKNIKKLLASISTK